MVGMRVIMRGTGSGAPGFQLLDARFIGTAVDNLTDSYKVSLLTQVIMLALLIQWRYMPKRNAYFLEKDGNQWSRAASVATYIFFPCLPTKYHFKCYAVVAPTPLTPLRNGSRT